MQSAEHPIQLIVGLANPGAEYQHTRHNAGAWFVEQIARENHCDLRLENKFKGYYGKFSKAGEECHLLVPTTFMNHSGQAILAVSQFFKIAPENILVVHDELDLPVGSARLKWAGGHGGHNGLRDTLGHLSQKPFYRLRIGIGHPGHASAVVGYVLSRPNLADKQAMDEAIDKAAQTLFLLLQGKISYAMQQLHR